MASSNGGCSRCESVRVSLIARSINCCASAKQVLYVTLSESPSDLQSVARTHGIEIDGIHFLELKPSEQDLQPEGQYTVFHPAEIELNDRLQTIVSEVARHKPDRLVIDALSEVRMLAKDPLRYRRQIISLRERTPPGCTVLLLDDRSSSHSNLELHSIVHGVVLLEKVHREYGRTRRRIEVSKLRGCAFREGYHDYTIRTGGFVVFPRLVAAEHLTASDGASSVSCGIKELDALAGGGLDRGTSTLVIGPAGCGKTTISLSWLNAAAERGENTAAFIFEETVSTLMRRARGLGMDMQPLIDSGRVRIEHFDPAEMSPGEFIDKVRTCVDSEGARIVVIDSLNAFRHCGARRRRTAGTGWSCPFQVLPRADKTAREEIRRRECRLNQDSQSCNEV